MIRVNLLPQEYRKAEATPLKQFFATVGAVVLAAVAAAAWGWVFFTRLSKAETELAQVESEIKGQKGALDLVTKLDSKVRDLKAQFKLIDEVAKNRVVWSRKLDELWEVVVNPKAPGRYEVWITSLGCSSTTTGAQAKVGGQVQFAGTSAGSQMNKMVDFHEDLTTGTFFADFGKCTPPYGNREVVGPDNRDPKEGWNFNFVLELKSLKDISEAHAKAAAEAAKK